jgi:hypothetical protein
VWPGRREQPALTFPEKTIYGVRASSATRFFACVFFKCPAAERAGRGGPLFLRKTHRSRAVRVSDAALTQNFVRRKGLRRGGPSPHAEKESLLYRVRAMAAADAPTSCRVSVEVRQIKMTLNVPYRGARGELVPGDVVAAVFGLFADSNAPGGDGSLAAAAAKAHIHLAAVNELDSLAHTLAGTEPGAGASLRVVWSRVRDAVASETFAFCLRENAPTVGPEAIALCFQALGQATESWFTLMKFCREKRGSWTGAFAQVQPAPRPITWAALEFVHVSNSAIPRAAEASMEAFYATPEYSVLAYRCFRSWDTYSSYQSYVARVTLPHAAADTNRGRRRAAGRRGRGRGRGLAGRRGRRHARVLG